MKAKKEREVAEESLFLRMLWFAQTITCFFLVAMVDPQVCFLNLFGLRVPFLMFDFWVAISGLLLSYHYRHQNVKWLEWLGIGTIFICCIWFIDFMRMQFMSTEDIDILLPTVHLMAGLYVSHSFELRARNDFNFSLVFSIFLVCFAACIGKGAIFGLGMFVYVVLAATLLLLDCEAKTFGSVQARAIDGAQSFQMQRTGRSEKTANLLFPTFALLGLSVAFFLVAPRAESLADQVSAKIYSIIKKDIKSLPSQHFPNNRLRTPFRPPHEPAPRQEPDKKNAVPPPPPSKIKKEAEKAKGANSGEHESSAEKTKSSGKGKTFHNKYSRKEEQKKRETEKKNSDRAAQQAPFDSSFAGKGAKSDGPTASNENDADTANKMAKQKNKPSQEGKKSLSEPTQKNPGDSSAQDSSTSADQPNAGARNEGSPKQSEGEAGKDQKKPNDSGSGEQKDASASKKSDSSTKSADEKDNSKLKGKEGKTNPKTTANKSDGKKQEGKSPPEQESKKEGVHFIPDSLNLNGQAATEDTAIFSVICNRTVYFKQGAYDQFDGQNWSVSPDIRRGGLPRAENDNFSAKEAIPIKLPPTVPAIRLKQKYHMLANLDSKLMVAGNPYEIQYAGPSIEIDECGNLKGGWLLVKGLEYQVWSDDPLYDLKEMRAEGLPGDAEEERMHDALSRFMQMPENHSEEFFNLSRKLTGPQDNWFVQAETISGYLRKNFKYSLEKNRSKSNVYKNAVDRFLFESKQGDCKDFASAFVLLCRASGIPARMVVGFSPGDFDSGSGSRIVKLKNTHAWGEIYFPSYGWVPFDATPTGIMPGREEEEERYFTSIGEKLDKTVKSQSGTAGQNGEASEPGTRINLGNGKTIVINIGPWDIFKGIIAALAVTVLSGPIMFLCKDLFLMIRFPKPMHPASKIYSKLLGDLKALGVARNDSQTGGELVQLLEENLQEIEDRQTAMEIKTAVEGFVADYNALYFGGLGSLKQLEQKRAQIKSMLKGRKLISSKAKSAPFE